MIVFVEAHFARHGKLQSCDFDEVMATSNCSLKKQTASNYIILK